MASPDNLSEKRKLLSPSGSKRFVFGLIMASLLLAFLAALGIKAATENPDFQQEVQNMREMHDPNFKASEGTSDTKAQPANNTLAADSTQQP